MSLSRQIEMADKLEVTENDKRLRGASSQGSTFFAHTHNDVGGRYAAISSPVVVGEKQIPAYPAGPNWCSADQGLEPPLGVDINALEPTGEIAELRASLAELSAGSGRISQAPTPNPASDAAPTSAGHSNRTTAVARHAGLGSSRTYRRA